MNIISNGKLDDAPKPKEPKPISVMQNPNSRLRRLARSAKKPDGKLATPAIRVRAEANAPACARLSPKAEVMIGKITAMTALKRCSVICAVELAAKRPHVASGAFSVVAVSALDKVRPLWMNLTRLL